MHLVLVNRLAGLSISSNSVVKFTYRPDMTIAVYRGRRKTTQQSCRENKFLPLRAVSHLEGTLLNGRELLQEYPFTLRITLKLFDLRGYERFTKGIKEKSFLCHHFVSGFTGFDYQSIKKGMVRK